MDYQDEVNVYDLICRRYAMQFLDDYKYSSSKIKTKVDGLRLNVRNDAPDPSKEIGAKLS